MKTIRDNSPYVLGYVAYFVYYTALVQLIWIGILFVFPSYSSFLFNSFELPVALINIRLPLSFGLQLFINYLCFLASIRWIALPLIKRSQNVLAKTEQTSLVLDFFVFSLFVFIYGNLPMAFLQFFPITKEIQNIVRFIWIAIISYDLYKDVVSTYAFSPAQNVPNKAYGGMVSPSPREGAVTQDKP